MQPRKEVYCPSNVSNRAELLSRDNQEAGVTVTWSFERVLLSLEVDVANESRTFRDSTPTEAACGDEHWACEIRDEKGGLVGRGDSFDKEEGKRPADHVESTPVKEQTASACKSFR
jgi:hypothetical protein